MSLHVNLAQFILDNNKMFPLSLKIQCAWHLDAFFITLVHSLSSNYCRAGVLLIDQKKIRKRSMQIAQSFLSSNVHHLASFRNTHSIVFNNILWLSYYCQLLKKFSRPYILILFTFSLSTAISPFNS